ncbi:MAG: branched-chain amino acid ABC transporter permease [Acidimicrobiales bacterium]
MRATRSTTTPLVTRYSRGSLSALGVSGVLVVVLAWLPAFIGESTINRLTQFFSLLILAIGWNLLAGYGGMVSIGQQAFLGLSSYAVLYLSLHGVLAWWGVPIAIAFAGAVSVPISFLAFRLRGSFFAIGTWVIADVCLLVVAQVETLGGGAGASLNDLNGYRPMTVDNVTYWIGLAIAVASLVVCALVLRSRLGMALVAIRDDERAAVATGVNVPRTKRVVYVIAAAICGGAGALLILANLEVQPDSTFSVQYSAFMIFMVLVGGIGTFEGPIVGAIVFFALQQWLAAYGAWYLIILGAVAVTITLWLPKGIWGTFDPHNRRSLVPLRHRVTGPIETKTPR